MVVLGFGAIWQGGLVFILFIVGICGAMVWELSRMIEAEDTAKALQMGLMTSAMLLISSYISPFYILPFLLAPGLAGAARMSRMHGVYLAYAFIIALAGISLISVRGNLGFGWILWLILVVVATDVAGYFTGKMIGGPKFWPRISPKKTWSGTVAGWVAAGIVGALFSTLAGAGTALILISVLMSMASQAGDIAESALKRRTGVKDSSALIPGHGGVMDRFDGMLGAALFVLLTSALFGFPAGLV